MLKSTRDAAGRGALRVQAWTGRWIERWDAHRRETGQGMVEYALILVLIAMVVIVMLTFMGKDVNNAFSNVNNGLAH